MSAFFYSTEQRFSPHLCVSTFAMVAMILVCNYRSAFQLLAYHFTVLFTIITWIQLNNVSNKFCAFLLDLLHTKLFRLPQEFNPDLLLLNWTQTCAVKSSSLLNAIKGTVMSLALCKIDGRFTKIPYTRLQLTLIPHIL